MQWPVLPTQPDGDQPGLLLPPPAPWIGEPLPEAVTKALRPREVPTWVGHPIGAPKMPWDWVWSRYERATLLGMFGAVLLVPGLITGTVAPAVVGGLLCAAGVGALILPPVVRRHRRQQTWWVLTPDRLGDVCVARPARESWVERGEVEEVLVRGLRADGSGTVVVKVNPRASLRDERVLPISEVVIGRVPGAAELADQIGLLRYDLS